MTERMTIYQFPLEVTDRQTVTVPGIWKPLCVQLQHGRPCIWAEVDPTDSNVINGVIMVGTGQPSLPMPAGFRYLGTVQVQVFVWHVYVDVGVEE